MTSAANDAQKRGRYLEGLSADYANLRSDPVEWKEFCEEFAEFDTTLSDGLPDEVLNTH